MVRMLDHIFAPPYLQDYVKQPGYHNYLEHCALLSEDRLTVDTTRDRSTISITLRSEFPFTAMRDIFTLQISRDTVAGVGIIIPTEVGNCYNTRSFCYVGTDGKICDGHELPPRLSLPLDQEYSIGLHFNADERQVSIFINGIYSGRSLKMGPGEYFPYVWLWKGDLAITQDIV
jgi:hypothetical protein